MICVYTWRESYGGQAIVYLIYHFSEGRMRYNGNVCMPMN